MIRVRPFDRESDYPAAEAWWKGHAFEPVPLNLLPSLGMVAEYHDEEAGHEARPVAMAWLYLDNSTGVGMLEWIVADPAAKPRASALAIGHVVRCLRRAAGSIGYGVILASCRQASLARLLERCGFQQTDPAVIHLISINPVDPS